MTYFQILSIALFTYYTCAEKYDNNYHPCPYGSSTIYVYNGTRPMLNQTSSQNECKRFNGALVKVTSQSKQEAISGCLNYLKGIRQFYWIDYDEREQANYTNFGPGYSFEKNQCVIWNTEDTRWSPYECYYKIRFICEKKTATKSSMTHTSSIRPNDGEASTSQTVTIISTSVSITVVVAIIFVIIAVIKFRGTRQAPSSSPTKSETNTLSEIVKKDDCKNVNEEGLVYITVEHVKSSYNQPTERKQDPVCNEVAPTDRDGAVYASVSKVNSKSVTVLSAHDEFVEYATILKKS